MTPKRDIIRSFKAHLQKDNTERFRFCNRFELKVENISPDDWLKFRTTGPKVYWKDRRSQLEIAAIGKTEMHYGPDLADFSDLFYRIREVLNNSDPRIRYYGGLSFTRHNHHETIWKDFGDYYFLLPRYEMLRKDGRYKFAINYRAGEEQTILNELPGIFELPLESQMIAPVLTESLHIPDRDAWRSMIGGALDSIRREKYEKIVLARKTRFGFTERLNPAEILQNLKSLNPGSIYFLIQPRPDSVFIGGTPELLYRRSGDEIFSEAIAGTRMRGKNEQEDEILENELLNSGKDRHEHLIVMDNVREILRSMCSRVDASPDVTVLKLSRVQHLYADFHGRLKKDITDAEIIARLHPTPAVGGFPTENALPEIERLEPFRRGWYAAPVGWLSRDSAHFAVAIRSGLILDSDLYLYSGAGIVEGSEADLEWEELDNKIANFLRVLNINGDEPVSVDRDKVSLDLK